jgi:hypothetical protein
VTSPRKSRQTRTRPLMSSRNSADTAPAIGARRGGISLACRDLDRPAYSRPTGIRAGGCGRARGTRRIPAVGGGGSGSGCGDRGGVGNERG